MLDGRTVSWNDLKDKPFYEETITVNEPLNITWDGNTEGLVSVLDVFYKVSNLVLTDEQIQLVTVRNSSGNESTIDNFCETLEDITVFGFPTKVSVVKKDNAELEDGIVFPQKGIYFMSTEGRYVTSLTTTEPIEQTKTVIKKLDEKYLPDSVGGGGAGGGDVFVVNIISSFSGDYPDKTYDEILQAHNEHRPIEFHLNNGNVKVVGYQIVGNTITFNYILYVAIEKLYRLRRGVFNSDNTYTQTDAKLTTT